MPAAAPVPRARIVLDFEPLSAQSTLYNLRMVYAVTVRNEGDADSGPLSLRFGLFTGAQADERTLRHWFANDGSEAHHAIEGVARGAEHRFEGELSAALDALKTMTVENRTIVVPVIGVDTRYGRGDGDRGGDGQAARAFVVGRETGGVGGKLAPLRLDRGPTDFGSLGKRDTGIAVNQ